MPFYYTLPLPEVEPESTCAAVGVVFRRYLVPDRAMVEQGTPVAHLERAGDLIEVLANGEGMVSQLVRVAGERLRTGEALATIHADGEKLPYGRPAAEWRRVDRSQTGATSPCGR
jgi:pyruvate/2-oxoglutarate dehydrogenase complex dihydrolipoamide acyltransferase (E2) component